MLLACAKENLILKAFTPIARCTVRIEDLHGDMQPCRIGSLPYAASATFSYRANQLVLVECRLQRTSAGSRLFQLGLFALLAL